LASCKQDIKPRSCYYERRKTEHRTSTHLYNDESFSGYYILVEIGISALAAIVSVLISFFRGVKQLTKRQENAKESRQDKKYFDLVQPVTWGKTKNEVL
jgi:hypothetical protein